MLHCDDCPRDFLALSKLLLQHMRIFNIAGPGVMSTPRTSDCSKLSRAVSWHAVEDVTFRSVTMES